MIVRRFCETIALALPGMTVATVADAAALGAGAYSLRLTLVWVCAGVAAGIYAVTVFGLVVKRPTRQVAAPPSRARRHTELLWAVIPAIIVIALASPAVEHLARLAAGADAGPGIKTSAILR